MTGCGGVTEAGLDKTWAPPPLHRRIPKFHASAIQKMTPHPSAAIASIAARPLRPNKSTRPDTAGCLTSGSVLRSAESEPNECGPRRRQFATLASPLADEMTIIQEALQSPGEYKARPARVERLLVAVSGPSANVRYGWKADVPVKSRSAI